MENISITKNLAKNLWQKLSDLCTETANQVAKDNVIMSQSKLATLSTKLSDEHQRAFDMNTRVMGSIRRMENMDLQISMDVSSVIDTIHGFTITHDAIEKPHTDSTLEVNMQRKTPVTQNVNEQLSDKDLSNIKLRFGSAGSKPGEFLDPSCMIVDCRGDIIVVDTGNNRIQRFDSSGVFQLSIDQLSQPRGIVISPLNCMIVAETDNADIKMYKADGSLHDTISGWNTPYAPAIDDHGNMHVCVDKYIQILTQEGTPIVSQELVTIGISSPRHIGFLSDAVCVSDGRKCLILDQSYSRVLHELVLTCPITALCCARNHGDHVLTTDENHRVHIYDHDGRVVKVLVSRGQLFGPRSLTVDDKGDVYVLCKSEVVKF